ncbi:MAG: hypothetical protein HOO97_05350, partial [Sideroxydans sp.]|nr:hypothetical protein [Sideroxydans sp.]
MKKIFISLCLFYSCNAFAVIEAVAPIREDWSNQWTTASINHFPDGTSACNALLLYFNVSNKVYTLSSFVINPFFPDIGTCNFSGMQNGVALPYAITRVDTVSALHICPTPPNLPFFVYNQTTFLCERENPCASQSLISTGWAIGTAPVGQVTTFCAFPLNCTTTQTVLRSALGMSIVNNNRDGTSCLPDSAVLPPDALKVTLSPSAVPIENKSPADTAVFDQLVADKAAADAKSAAAAAASANATAATAAQAAADQAAADAYIASVIARANALKSGLPVLNVPSSP